MFNRSYVRGYILFFWNIEERYYHTYPDFYQSLCESVVLLVQAEGNEEEILDAYTSDLLSDVMGNSPEDSVLITIQAHKNTVAVASLANINVLLICNLQLVQILY